MRHLKNIIVAVCLLFLVAGVDKTPEKADYRTVSEIQTSLSQVTEVNVTTTGKIQFSESQSDPSYLKTKNVTKREKSENPAEFIPQIRRFGFTN